MKKALKKQDWIFFVCSFFVLVMVHFPLLTKKIISADILLNNQYYRGYSWEISLGRFGLYIIGILKSFLSFPTIDIFISFFIILGILFLLFDLFEVKDLSKKILIGLIFILSPYTSATLTFHYCSIAYFLSFLFGVLSIYSFYKVSNRYLKWIIPIICIVASLSIYQAYFSLIISVFIFYQLKLILDQKIEYKKSLFYILLFLGSVIIYFIGMKLSLLVFHIDMASYSNANGIGISILLQIPHKFIDSYRLFYEYFFTNQIMTNTYLYNHVLHFIMIFLFIVCMVYQFIQKKLKNVSIVLFILGILLLPVFLNSVIFVIDDAKLQLLMSVSYLLIPFFLIINFDQKIMKIISIILFVLLLRNYFIQDEASYLSLENTYQKYNTVIGTAIKDHINDLDSKFVIIGSLQNKDILDINHIHNYTYGYICDYDLFWNEYHLRKLGFERFVYEEYGLEVEFADEDIYQSILENSSSNALIYQENGVIVINFNNY